MTKNVIVPANLGDEFDIGVIEPNKIHVKTDPTIVRDGVTGLLGVDICAALMSGAITMACKNGVISLLCGGNVVASVEVCLPDSCPVYWVDWVAFDPTVIKGTLNGSGVAIIGNIDTFNADTPTGNTHTDGLSTAFSSSIFDPAFALSDSAGVVLTGDTDVIDLGGLVFDKLYIYIDGIEPDTVIEFGEDVTIEGSTPGITQPSSNSIENPLTAGFGAVSLSVAGPISASGVKFVASGSSLKHVVRMLIGVEICP